MSKSSECLAKFICCNFPLQFFEDQMLLMISLWLWCRINFTLFTQLSHVYNWKANSSEHLKWHWTKIENTGLVQTNIFLFGDTSFDRASNTQILNATLEYILSQAFQLIFCPWVINHWCKEVFSQIAWAISLACPMISGWAV